MGRTIMKRVRSLFDADQGITATEYAIIAAVVAVVVVAAVGFVGSELTRSYLDLANSMSKG